MSSLASVAVPAAETSVETVISIAIKSLNEEAKIARAIESALAAIAYAGLNGEVVLADSGSADRTIEIARRYPITVVQIADPAMAGCGTGVELGFQHSRGTFVLFMDGDMALEPDFIDRGIAYLEAHPDVAGVAGLLTDEQINNAEDRIRASNQRKRKTGDQPWLDGGGLYRRKAIMAAGGYAAHSALRADEEAELGMRLRHAGYRLVRLPGIGVRHWGHEVGSLTLVARNWRSGRAMSGGVLLRQSLKKPWLRDVLWLHRIQLLVSLWWAIGALWIIAAPDDLRWPGFVLLPLGVVFAVCAMAVRKGDLIHAAMAVFHWHYDALGMFIGLCFPLKEPGKPLPVRVVRTGGGSSDGDRCS